MLYSLIISIWDIIITQSNRLPVLLFLLKKKNNYHYDYKNLVIFANWPLGTADFAV
jgi:hypothetical protein